MNNLGRKNNLAITSLLVSVVMLVPTLAQAKKSTTTSVKAKTAKSSAKKTVRQPASTTAKSAAPEVTSIPRRELAPERKFEFEFRPAVIPDVPKRVASPAPRPVTPEFSIRQLNSKLEPTTTLPAGAKAFGSPKGTAPTLSSEAEFKFKTPEDKIKPVDKYTADELQLFDAYVMLEDLEKPLPALGSFATLMGKKSNLQDSARWGYAHSALALGLRVQYELTLLDFVNRASSNWGSRALDSLVKNSDPEKSVWIQHLTTAQFDNLNPEKPTDGYLMLRVHRLVAAKQVKDALETLKLISPDSKIYGLRAYHEALLTYRQGQLAEARQILSGAISSQPSSFSENEIKAKAYMLLGRLSFQSRDFNKAFDAYRSVPKNNPVWPEAMMEQALSQILFEDFEGAAGNMFSLHTDFYKKSYSPDSYLIRTVGYLNLCQYADAHQVVQDLQRKYKPILNGLDSYNKTTSSAKDYETIREFAKNPAASDVRGLARPFLFAWTQDPDFQRHQVRINQFEDELEAFRGLSLQVVKLEREMTKKISDASQALLDAGNRKASEDQMARLRDQLERVKTESKLLQIARKSLAQIRPEMTAKLENLKDERKQLALQALTQKRKDLHASLKGIVDQSEVLLYEIYNGAGDHLRFQAAGGEIESRRTAALDAQKEKATNWKFKGEIWEDELGHFRSSLSNICSKEVSSK